MNNFTKVYTTNSSELAICNTNIHAKKKGAKAQNRLVNVLRSILNRRTHLSRLFGLPVLNLPDVDKLTDRVEFCDGEKLIYDAIFNAFMDNIACQFKGSHYFISVLTNT